MYVHRVHLRVSVCALLCVGVCMLVCVEGGGGGMSDRERMLMRTRARLRAHACVSAYNVRADRENN